MKYCDECEHLKPTEADQNKTRTKGYHTCILLNKQVKHLGHHPQLPVLPDCPLLKKEV
jgi:hypothetical protein